MKVHPDGTLEGAPHELTEYMRLKGEQRIEWAPSAPNTWQPRTWPYGGKADCDGTSVNNPDLRWQNQIDCGGFGYQPPYPIMYGNSKPHGSGTQA